MHVLSLVAALPLLFAPILTHESFERAYEVERRQIGLDNAAIRLGRAERAIFDALSRSGAALARLETAHHAWHACAAVPATRAKCLPVDQSLEARIRGLHAKSWAMAAAAWKTAPAAAWGDIARSGGSVCRSTRSPSLPVTPVPCPRCALASGFRPIFSRLSHRLESCDPAVSPVGIRHLGEALAGERWDYRLLDEASP